MDEPTPTLVESPSRELPARTPLRFRWWHASLLFLIAIFGINWPTLWGHAMEQWDARYFHLPFYVLVADFVQEHRLLYWNPWTNGGSPDFADPQVGAFSPILLLFGFFGGSWDKAFRTYWICVWALGGLGMLGLARHLRAPVWGGLAVALGFGLSGYYTGHAEHLTVVYSYSFLPLVIWRLDVGLLSRRWGPAAEAGALWGLSALGGNPLLTMLTACFAGLWALGRWRMSVAEGEAKVTLSRSILAVALLGLVGAAVLSPAYFSFLHEGAGFSDRTGALPLEQALQNSLYPGAMATFSSPYVSALRATVAPEMWSYTDVSSGGMYLGSATLVLAGFSLLMRPRSGWRWFLLVIGLLALGCAFGQALPLRTWLYTLFPPSRFFRHPSMFRGYFLFSLALLALAGARDLQARLESEGRMGALQRLLGVALAFGVAGVAVFSMLLNSLPDPGKAPDLATAHNFVAWLGLGALSVAALALREKFPPRRWLPASIALLALVDGLLAVRLSEPTLYDEHVKIELDDLYNPGISLGAAKFDRAFATYTNLNLLAKLPTLSGYSPFKNRFHEAYTRTDALAQSALGPNRVWFASEAPEVPWNDAAFVAFAKRFIAAGGPVLVRHARADLLGRSAGEAKFDPAALEKAPVAVRQTPRIIEYESDRLALQVDCPSDGWVLVTDRWSRSWNATVNGVATPVECGNFIFRALPVKKGVSEIRFVFEPAGLPLLLIVSWGTLAAVAVWSVVHAVRARRPVAA